MALVVLLAASCAGGDEPVRPATAYEPPVVTIAPAPGAYEGYALDVTVTVRAAEGIRFYYEYAKPPEPGASREFVSPLKLRLVKNTQIQVLVAGAARTWGPYVFEYVFHKPPSGGGGCRVTPLTKVWFKGGESVPIGFEYVFSAALSQLIALIDGVESVVAVPSDSSSGTQFEPAAFAPGAHTVSCAVRMPLVPDVMGDPVTFAVDAQAPAAAWITSGGAFSHENWPGLFRLQAADGESGLEAGQICVSAGLVCMPMLELGGDVYAYATALTSQIGTSSSLTAMVSDRAGNTTTLAPLTIDLSAFGEPPVPAVLPITLTTDATLNVSTFLGRSVSEVCDLQLTLPCYDPANVPLAVGWNDFLFRGGGRLEWESLGIYRNGVRALLPAGAFTWLVYTSQGTAPLMQASLVAVTTSVNDWQRAWFDIPHLYFVEDVNANRRWDQYDNLFTVATDRFTDGLLASMTPLETTPVLYPFPPQPATMTVSVSCPQDCGSSGRLYFERRLSLYAYPETHTDLGPTIAAAVTVPATMADGCLFFWDENADGVVNGMEPRSAALCSSAVVLARQDGVLAWEQLSPPSPYWRLTGLPFGGVVARTIEYLSTADEPLVTRAWPPLYDSDGVGWILQPLGGEQGDPPLPGVKARLVFRVGGQVTSATLTSPEVTPQPYSYQVTVTDETGSTLAALVRGDQGGFSTFGIAEAFGFLSVGFPAASPFPAFAAFRDGYLSVTTEATDFSVGLRLLSTAVTGLISGVVVDTHGVPVSNATVSWSAPPYVAKTLSGPEGVYAIPASGGTGILSVSAPGKYERAASYALDVTRMTAVQAVVLPADEELFPMGLRLGYAPDVTGPDLLRLAYGDLYYAAQVSGAAPLFVDWFGMRREVDSLGFLPATPGTFGTYLVVDLPFLEFVRSRAVCGARAQDVLGGVQLDSACWSWIGDEEGRQYYFGRLSPQSASPPVLGLGRVYVYVTQAATLPPDQTLLFHELMIGQTLPLELKSGAAFGHLPMGMYQVTTAGGVYLRDALGQVAVFTVSSNDPPSISLVLP